jgi:hypothetical protein
MEGIHGLEQKYNFTLPVSIVDILLFSNGCSVINEFIRREGLPTELIIGFFSIEEIDFAVQNIQEIEKEFHYYFSDVLLPVGDSGGVRYLCIGLSGEYEGKIYIINYQEYDYENLDSMITYVASSVDDLLHRLQPEYSE